MSDPRPATPGLEDYLRIPALSSSGMRTLLDCPAKFLWQQEHPVFSDEFDIGKLAHALVLDDQTAMERDFVLVDADSWRRPADQTTRRAAREAGKTGILPKDLAAAGEMAAAVQAHPTAGRLFAPGTGRPEQTLQWTDPLSGVPLKCRLDWLPNPQPGRRMLVADYKTAKSSDPRKFQRSVAEYGYHAQAAHNLAGIRACRLDPDPAFLFVVQEKDPPYVVTVIELDQGALQTGEQMVMDAIRLYLRCSASGHWPGYSDEVALVELPPWYVRPTIDID